MRHNVDRRVLGCVTVLMLIATGCVVSPVPTMNPVAGFRVQVEEGGTERSVEVSSSGDECDELGKELAPICVIAVMTDPVDIGGNAFGQLNTVDTPAYEALIWRARVSGDVSVCGRGGLLDERLARCEGAATDPAYEIMSGGVTFTIPIDQ